MPMAENQAELTSDGNTPFVTNLPLPLSKPLSPLSFSLVALARPLPLSPPELRQRRVGVGSPPLLDLVVV
jgi:hypothetical protein